MNHEVNIRADLITPKVALSLIPAFTAAYDMALFASETVDFCGGIFKSQILPHLTNWAVEYELHRRTSDGIIPFSCIVSQNARKNHKHVELHRNGFLLTVSQTRKVLDVPRDCIFRNNHSWDGQIAMEQWKNDVEPASNDIYAIITHGRCNAGLSFVFCGIPNPEMTAWAQGINLFDMTMGMTIIDSSPINDDIKLDYRDAVKELIQESM